MSTPQLSTEDMTKDFYLQLELDNELKIQLKNIQKSDNPWSGFVFFASPEQNKSVSGEMFKLFPYDIAQIYIESEDWSEASNSLKKVNLKLMATIDDWVKNHMDPQGFAPSLTERTEQLKNWITAMARLEDLMSFEPSSSNVEVLISSEILQRYDKKPSLISSLIRMLTPESTESNSAQNDTSDIISKPYDDARDLATDYSNSQSTPVKNSLYSVHQYLNWKSSKASTESNYGPPKKRNKAFFSI